MWYIFVIIVILIIVNGVFAASEMALVSISRKDLNDLKETNQKRAKLLEKVLSDSTKYLSTIQVAITLAGFLSSAIAGYNISEELQALFASVSIQISSGLAMVIVTLILSYLSLVFGELVPKRIALNSPKKIALLCAPMINITMIITKPFVLLLSASTHLVIRILGIKPKSNQDEMTEKDLREMIVYGHMQGLYQTEEKLMMERVLHFDDLKAKMIMTPKEDMVAIDMSMSLEEIKGIIKKHKYSRIPVYEDYQIIGVLVIKDILFKELTKADIKAYIREPFIIDETVVINELFHQMKKQNLHLAFIFDKKDQTLKGIVTLEDIIEEIVGNIYDEHDDIEQQTSPFTYFVEGDMTLAELKHTLGLSFKGENLKQSIGNYLLSKQIDGSKEITLDHITYTILKEKKHKVVKVKIHMKEKA